MEATITTQILTDEIQQAQHVRPPGEPRGRDEALRGLFEDLEGHSRAGFMAFRGVPGPDERLDFRCIYLNRAAERLLGSRQGRGALRSSLELPGGGDLSDRFAEAMHDGEPIEGRVHGTVDGRERWYRGTFTPFRDGITVRFDEVPEQERLDDALPRDTAYRLLSRATNDVLWDWDVVTGRVAWGEALPRMLGYRLEEARPAIQWWIERVHPEDRERMVEGLYSAVDGSREAWSSEFRCRRADGGYAFIFARGFIVRDGRGRALRMVGSMMDFTDRVRAEEAILQRDLVYQLLSRAANDVLWDWNMASGEVRWGEALRRVFGYAPEESKPTLQWWIDLLHPEDRERVVGALSAAVQGGGEAWKDAFRLRRANGEYAFVLGRGYVARDAAGKPFRVVGSLVDLTDRVRAEEALRESEERFRVTFNQAAVGLALVSAEGRCLRANQRLCDILGYTGEELGQRSFEELSHPEELDESVARLGHVLSGEVRSDTLERRLRRKDGSFTWVRLTLSAARTPEGGAAWAIAVAEDIEERKRLEAGAKRAAEFEHQLYGMMGHDIRSPLAALKATVSAMIAHPDGLTGSQRRALARISRSTNRIHRLVQELLDYTRLRLGDGVPIQPRRTDARDICELVTEQFEHEFPGRVTLCDTGVEGRVEWDAERIKQMLANMVENAVIHGAQDRPVWILLGGDGDRITLQVHNDGEPIPPERLPRLFEPFNYGPEVEQTVKVSLGLGLYLVKEVARAHGGTVAVRSTREDGTTFIVTLPRRLGQSPELHAH